MCAAGCVGSDDFAPAARGPGVAAQARALFAEAEALRAAGKLVAAADAYDIARLADPTGDLGPGIARGWLAIGRALAIDGVGIEPFGLGLFADRQRGIDLLVRLAEVFPNSPEAEAALYAIGESHLISDEPALAQGAFDDLCARAPDSPWTEPAAYQRAEALLRLGRGVDYDRGPIEQARWHLQMYVARFPGGANRAHAEARLGEIAELLAEKDWRTAGWYARHGDAGASRIYLASIVREYPTTTYATRARAALGAPGAP